MREVLAGCRVKKRDFDFQEGRKRQ